MTKEQYDYCSTCSQDDLIKFLRQPEIMFEIIENQSILDKIRELRYLPTKREHDLQQLRLNIGGLIDTMMHIMSGATEDYNPPYKGFGGGDADTPGCNREIFYTTMDLPRYIKYMEEHEEEDLAYLHDQDICVNYLIKDNYNKQLSYFNGDDAYLWIDADEELWAQWETLCTLLPKFNRWQRKMQFDFKHKELEFKDMFLNSDIRYGYEDQLIKEVNETREAWYAKKFFELDERDRFELSRLLRETECKDLKEYFGAQVDKLHIVNKPIQE